MLKSCFGVAGGMAVALTSVAAAAAAEPAFPLTRVLGTGDAAPGVPGVTVEKVERHFNLAADGRVAVRATLSGAGVTTSNDAALFAGPYAAPSLVIREGAPAPLVDGSTFGFADSFVMNESGQIAIHGAAFQGQSGNTLIYVRSGDTWSIPARRYDPAPGTNSVYSGFFSPLVFNDAGEIAFKATLSPGLQPFAEALFMGTAGDMHLMGQTGAPIAGYDAAGNIGSIRSYGNFSEGGVGFGSWISSTSIAVAGRPGNLTLVARGDTQAAGMPAGVRYGTNGFSDVSVSPAGTVTFAASLSNVPSGGATQALYVGAPTSPQPVLTNKHAVPGVAGATFSGFGQPILIDNGEVMFFASLAGAGITAGNNEALFVGDPSDPRLIAREGAQAPGRPAGATFTEFEGPGRGGSGQLVYNDLGHIAFRAYDTTGAGIWATDADGGLDLIVHAGDELTVGGSPKTVYDVTLIGHQWWGLGTSYADDGRLALHLTFTDDSTAVYLTTVPEPSSAVAAAALLSVAVLARRRGRRAATG
jgi:hypothetical protein